MHKNKLNTPSVQTPSSAKQIKIGNYILGTTIGKGNSAVVKIATHSIIKHKAAIKIFDKSGLDSEKQLRLRREIDSMKRLKHQNIICLYEIMETPKFICLVTEYANNGELYDFIMHKKRLSEREARHIFKQIVTAVHYCHVNHIVHRDIKVENILLDSNFRVKLADFGFSSVYKEGELLDVWCGSPQYCAPELYKAEFYDGPKVDIWSLGVVLYVLVCGYLPFEAQVFTKLRSQVISGSYKKPFFLSEDCKSLIDGMLTLDPKKRFSITDIINHKWFRLDSDSFSFNLNSSSTSFGSNGSSNNSDNSIYQDFRSLIDKIEQISIKEFKPDESVLLEISQYDISTEDVIKSVRNNEFDSYAGIYYLVEAKLNDTASLNNFKHQNSANRIAYHQDFISFNDSYDMTSNTNSTNDENNNHNHNHIKTSLNYSKCESNINNFITNAQESSTINPVKRSFNELITSNFNNNTVPIECYNNYSNHIKTNSQMTNHLTGFKTIRSNECNLEDMTTSSSCSNNNDDQDEEDDENEDNEEDDEDEMPIEELGRDYLRYSAIRRHTIGTNFDNNQNNSVAKSTECLHMLNHENDAITQISNTSSNNNISSIVNINNTNDSFSNDINSNRSFMNSTTTNHTNSDLFNVNINNNPFIISCNAYQAQQLENNNLMNSFSLLQNQQEKNRFQDMNYLHPFPANTNCISNCISNNCKEENKTKALKQSTELGSKKYLHRQYHTNYSKLARSKHARFNGSEQQQQQQQQIQPRMHQESNLVGRRASDGGSNISLFNQFYSLRNVYKTQCNTELDTMPNQDSLNVNSIGATLYQSRGSITSGIPIFSASTQLAESSRPESPNTQVNNNNSSPTGGSSEDDEMNLGSSNVIKHHRKTSRHEPYTESNSSMSKLCRPVSPFTRKREQSFSGSNSPALHGFNDSFNRCHRGSEPNQLEIIVKFNAHLERIYNQSINAKANVSPNKELLMLQQENPSIDERTQLELQHQHQNLFHNLQNNTEIAHLNGSYSSAKSPISNANFHNGDTIDLNESLEPDQSISTNYLNTSPYSSELSQENPSTNTTNANTNSTNLSMLQIIQEEQNEMSMTLSSSSSLSSSPSITPRTIRSTVSLNKQAFEYPILANDYSDDKNADKQHNKNSILNQYIPNMNRLQNNQ